MGATYRKSCMVEVLGGREMHKRRIWLGADKEYMQRSSAGLKLPARVAASWRLRLQREVTNYSTVCCGAQTIDAVNCRLNMEGNWFEGRNSGAVDKHNGLL